MSPRTGAVHSNSSVVKLMAPKLAKSKSSAIASGRQASRTNPFGRVSPQVVWMLLATFALICLVTLITVAYLYYTLVNQKTHPLDEPMKILRNTMAFGLRNPDLNHNNPRSVADEVVKLPAHIQDVEKYFIKQKAKYQSLFNKGVKSVRGWQHFGNGVYYISRGKKNWYDAENFCISRDAHLASVLSSEEQTYITSQFTEPAWIGLTDAHEEGHWEWTDGSRLIAQFWSQGHPGRLEHHEHQKEECTSIVPLSSRFNWNEADCNQLNQWVCKESLKVVNPKTDQSH